MPSGYPNRNSCHKIDPLKLWRGQVGMEAYSQFRRHSEDLWILVSKPIKFPAPDRRRREDREIPKAA